MKKDVYYMYINLFIRFKNTEHTEDIRMTYDYRPRFELMYVIRILKGIQNLFELHEFPNYRSSDYFGKILKKIRKRCFFTM